MEPTNTQTTGGQQGGNGAANNKPLYIAAAIIIPVVAAGYFLFGKSNEAVAPTTDDTNTANGNTNGTSEEAGPTGDTIASVYKDGTYEVKGNYVSPAGPEEFPISFTIASGVIVDTSMTVNSENPGSVNFQTQFMNGYKDQVIGKNIDEVSITKVSGSSLTPKGFNDAIADLKVQAKS